MPITLLSSLAHQMSIKVFSLMLTWHHLIRTTSRGSIFQPSQRHPRLQTLSTISLSSLTMPTGLLILQTSLKRAKTSFSSRFPKTHSTTPYRQTLPKSMDGSTLIMYSSCHGMSLTTSSPLLKPTLFPASSTGTVFLNTSTSVISVSLL